MKVLVTFAVSAEFAPWRRMAGFSRFQLNLPSVQSPSSCKLYRAEIADSEVFVVLTEMGSESARRATNYALGLAPEICISSGLAGGLRPDYACADIVVAGRVTQFGGENLSLASSPKLVETAVTCGARRAQRFLTVSEVVIHKSVKQAMSEIGDAVEMESLGVLVAAQAARVPAVAIRAISDPVHKDMPIDFNQVLDRGGKVRPKTLLREIVNQPAAIPGLLGFARDAHRAAVSLAKFLDRYVRLLDEFDDAAKATALAATA